MASSSNLSPGAVGLCHPAHLKTWDEYWAWAMEKIKANPTCKMNFENIEITPELIRQHKEDNERYIKRNDLLYRDFGWFKIYRKDRKKYGKQP